MVVKHCKELFFLNDQTTFFFFFFWNYENDVNDKNYQGTRSHKEVGSKTKGEIEVFLKCVNLMQPINYAQQDIISFYTHCHDIAIIICNSWPIVIEANKEIQISMKLLLRNSLNFTNK